MSRRTPGASTSFPSGQERQLYSPYWGVYPIANELPNASGNILALAHFTLEEGDIAAVVGLGLYRCVSAGTAGGADAVWLSIGNQLVDYTTLPTTADSYAAAAGFGVGSNDFVVAFWWRSSDNLQNSATVRPVIQARTGAGDGWQFFWNFGVASILVADGAAVDFGGNFGAATFWGGSPGYVQERDALVVIRVTGGGVGNARLRLYMNLAFVMDFTAANAGITPGTTPLTIGGTVGFGDALSGGFAGGAYLDGGLTDADLTAWMQACMDAGGIVEAGVAWDALWSTQSALPGATWTDETGNGNDLTLAGANGSQQRTLRLA